MKAIGVIKCGNVNDILDREIFNGLLEIYIHDTAKPLELIHYKNGKKSIFSDVHGGHFSPISELGKQVDGPIFVCVDPVKKPIINCIIDQIKEAMPCFDPLYAKPPSPIYVQEV